MKHTEVPDDNHKPIDILRSKHYKDDQRHRKHALNLLADIADLYVKLSQITYTTYFLLFWGGAKVIFRILVAWQIPRISTFKEHQI